MGTVAVHLDPHQRVLISNTPDSHLRNVFKEKANGRSVYFRVVPVYGVPDLLAVQTHTIIPTLPTSREHGIPSGTTSVKGYNDLLKRRLGDPAIEGKLTTVVQR